MKKRPLKLPTFILLWTFWPVIPVIMADLVAASLGCKTPHEFVSYPCIFFGQDIGETLSSMKLTAWYAFLTLPTGILALIVFALITLVRKLVAGQDNEQ